MRIKLTLSYDGTSFCGWQKQKSKKSVQQTVEDAVFSLTGEKVSVTGSGRTDAGVHAKGQVAHLDTNSQIPPQNFYRALNVFLPPDIRATASEKVSDAFSAVKSAKRKTYEYSLYISDVELPLKERYAVRLIGKTDFSLIKKGANLFLGEHDFKSFCSSGSEIKTTVRTIYKIKVTKKQNDIKISVTGNGFLYNMVRIIVGTLIKLGQGKMTLKELKEMLGGGGRSLGGNTFPAKGLCLKNVEY